MTTKKEIESKIGFLNQYLIRIYAKYYLKASERNDYWAIDLYDMAGNMIDYLTAGLTKKEVMVFLTGIEKGLNLYGTFFRTLTGDEKHKNN